MRLSLEQIGLWLGSPSQRVGFASGFKQDSRLVEAGDLFFALNGERVDGHTYLHEVSLKGAVAAVVSSAYRGEDFGLQLFRVADVLSALHQLARQVHLAYPCRVIGVTGSVGKTTTKEFIAALLAGYFRVYKTPGNANSQVGMPLSLLNARGDEEVFVAEMGMSQPGEIEKLVALAPPEVALITKIALSHVAFFPDGLEGIASAKAEIFSSPHTRVGVLNEQVLSFSSSTKGACPKVSYGREGAGCDFELVIEKGGYCIRERGVSSPLLSLPFSAGHLCENFAAAAVVAREMGLSWAQIQERAISLRPFSHRFESIEREGILFIDDSYNANPTSMTAAVHHLPPPQPACRRVAVLGAMKELGVYEEESHKLVGLEALAVVDHLLCLGKEWESMMPFFLEKGKPVELFQELSALKQRVFELVRTGDVVLLKGSNSNKLWQILS